MLQEQKMPKILSKILQKIIIPRIQPSFILHASLTEEHVPTEQQTSFLFPLSVCLSLFFDCFPHRKNTVVLRRTTLINRKKNKKNRRQTHLWKLWRCARGKADDQHLTRIIGKSCYPAEVPLPIVLSAYVSSFRADKTSVP